MTLKIFIAIKEKSGENKETCIGVIGMEGQKAQPPEKRPVAFKSKKQIKEEWAKLDLPDLDDSEEPTEEHSALDEIYQDDIHGLGNE